VQEVGSQTSLRKLQNREAQLHPVVPELPVVLVVVVPELPEVVGDGQRQSPVAPQA
jgi:hypothetical protein